MLNLEKMVIFTTCTTQNIFRRKKKWDSDLSGRCIRRQAPCIINLDSWRAWKQGFSSGKLWPFMYSCFASILPCISTEVSISFYTHFPPFNALLIFCSLLPAFWECFCACFSLASLSSNSKTYGFIWILPALSPPLRPLPSPFSRRSLLCSGT